jgi:hypothetical protein
VRLHTNGTHAARSETERAADWLRGYLANGPQPEQMVEYDAEQAGIDRPALQGAKDALHIVVTGDGGLFCVWRLPASGWWERSPGHEDLDDRPF